MGQKMAPMSEPVCACGGRCCRRVVCGQRCPADQERERGPAESRMRAIARRGAQEAVLAGWGGGVARARTKRAKLQRAGSDEYVDAPCTAAERESEAVVGPIGRDAGADPPCDVLSSSLTVLCPSLCPPRPHVLLRAPAPGTLPSLWVRSSMSAIDLDFGGNKVPAAAGAAVQAAAAARNYVVKPRLGLSLSQGWGGVRVCARLCVGGRWAGAAMCG